MALGGCGEVWTDTSLATTAWTKTTKPSPTWTENPTYCPLLVGVTYNSMARSYDDLATLYDAT